MKRMLGPALAVLLCVFCTQGAAQSLLVDPERTPDEVIELWPDGAPGGENIDFDPNFQLRDGPGGAEMLTLTNIKTPTISRFGPEELDGSAMLIIPGGGYSLIVVDHEGWESARWFSRMGTTVYTMTYRLPHQGWAGGADTPLQDAQRAIRVIRSRAEHDGIDPDRIMVLGFSAGGHLAGSLATRFDVPVYEAVDSADALSARPDAVALIYPVVTMAEQATHMGSRRNLIGDSPSREAIGKYSVETGVSADTPPTILIHAADDTVVPVSNSMFLFDRLRAAAVPSSIHIFDTGGHGFGMRGIDDTPLRAWPLLVIDFGFGQGIFGTD